MAAVSVTINGVIWDKQWRTARPVVLIGEAFLTGLEVGGGPIIPDQPPTSPGSPAFPIWGPPGFRPGAGFPDKPGYPTIPDQPIEPPIDVPPDAPPESIVKPPPADGGWGWSPAYGWGYFPGSGGAGPKK